MDKEYLKKLDAQASVTRELLSNKNKQDRERRICKAFLRCLDVEFRDQDMMSGPYEPIDIQFKSARFQIMEIMDEGRRRGDEYKELERKYSEAESLEDVETPYEPTFSISIGEIIDLLRDRLIKKEDKYGGDDLDILTYVNISGRHLNPNSEWPPTKDLIKFVWRSVSFLFPPYAIVIYATDQAPTFLRDACTRDFYQCEDVDGLFD